MNSFIAYENLSDLGTIAAESARPSLSVSNLQNVHVATPWRSQTVPTWAMTDLLEDRAVNVVALFGTNGLASTEIMVRASNDPSFATSLYDSGWIAGAIDPAFQSFIHILAESVTARYVRVDIRDDALEWFDAGRQFIGLGYRPPINFSWGRARGYRDPSVKTQSLGGQLYIDIRPKLRRLSLNFSTIRDAASSFFEDLDRVNGIAVDVLLCQNEQSANLGRDTIFGTVSAMTDIVAAANDVNSKSYVIEERK